MAASPIVLVKSFAPCFKTSNVVLCFFNSSSLCVVAAISLCKSLYPSSFTSFPASAISFCACVSVFSLLSVCVIACCNTVCFCANSSVFCGSSFKREFMPFSSFCKLFDSEFTFESALFSGLVFPSISTVIPFKPFDIAAYPLFPKSRRRLCLSGSVCDSVSAFSRYSRPSSVLFISCMKASRLYCK